MSDGQSYFEDNYGMSCEDWRFHTKGGAMSGYCGSVEDALVESYGHYPTEAETAQYLLKQRVIKAHWDSLSEDRRIRHIENILHQTPPESRKFEYARWWAEQIIDLVDNGVIGGEE